MVWRSSLKALRCSAVPPKRMAPQRRVHRFTEYPRRVAAGLAARVAGLQGVAVTPDASIEAAGHVGVSLGDAPARRESPVKVETQDSGVHRRCCPCARKPPQTWPQGTGQSYKVRAIQGDAKAHLRRSAFPAPARTPISPSWSQAGPSRIRGKKGRTAAGLRPACSTCSSRRRPGEEAARGTPPSAILHSRQGSRRHRRGPHVVQKVLVNVPPAGRLRDTRRQALREAVGRRPHPLSEQPTIVEHLRASRWAAPGGRTAPGRARGGLRRRGRAVGAAGHAPAPT